VETKAKEVRVAEVEEREEKRRSRKEMRREGPEKKKENNGGKESGRRMENMGQREVVAKLEKEAKRLVPEHFYK